MKKVVWIALAVIAAAGIYFGARKQVAEEEPSKAGKKVVVVINNGPKETNKAEVKKLKDTIARFNKVYPEIEIRWTDRSYSPDSFATSMAGGTAEDVSSVFATESYIADRGYALDLTELINNWEYKEQLNPRMLQPFTKQGRYYGFPETGYIMALAYNKRLFREAGIENPPQTWEEFVAAAKKLTDRKTGCSGFGIMGRSNFAGWGLLNWVWQAGGDFEKERNGKWKAVFAEPEAVRAVDFVRSLRWEHDVLQRNLLVGVEELMQSFAAGQLGMMLVTSTTYNIPLMVNQYKMKLEDVGLAMLPAGPAGRANQLGGSFAVINPTSPKEVQEAAFKWIAWRALQGYDPRQIQNLADLNRKQGLVTGTSSVPIMVGEIAKKADEVIDKNRDVFVVFDDAVEASKYIHLEPPFFCQQLYSEYLGPVIEAVLTNKNAAPKQSLAKAAANFESRFLAQVK
mgnify:CR=1 FL=1|jgi:ABC-type glycerol-3-phosphate transport system substrate-binding protein